MPLLIILGVVAIVLAFGSISTDSPLEDYARYEAVLGCDVSPKPGVLAFRAWVKENYGERPGSPENIVRACELGNPSEHHEGRAWDWMIPDDATAQALLDELLAEDECGNAHALLRRAGIMYVIYDRRMWRAYDRGPGFPAPREWSAYTGPNPHTDHVHFSFGTPGAMGETSFYASA